MVLNSVNFCLSEKLLISPSILNEILAGYSKLGCRFFSLSVLQIYPAISFWPAECLPKDQLLSILGFSCMLLVASPLLLLIFFVFSLCQFDQYVSWHVSPWVYPVWESLCLLDLIDCFLSMLENFSTIISSKSFSYPFFFSSSSGTPVI